jgi:hypothetical protein
MDLMWRNRGSSSHAREQQPGAGLPVGSSQAVECADATPSTATWLLAALLPEHVRGMHWWQPPGPSSSAQQQQQQQVPPAAATLQPMAAMAAVAAVAVEIRRPATWLAAVAAEGGPAALAARAMVAAAPLAAAAMTPMQLQAALAHQMRSLLP